MAESALTEGKKRAAADYQAKLTEIANAESPEAVDAIVKRF